jgi:hypothetical protein
MEIMAFGMLCGLMLLALLARLLDLVHHLSRPSCLTNGHLLTIVGVCGMLPMFKFRCSYFHTCPTYYTA